MRRPSIHVAGAILVSVALLFSCASTGAKPAFKSGTFQGSGTGHGGTVKVETTFKDGRIASIKIVEFGETAGIGDAARVAIPERIIKAQRLDVDTVSGATEASKAIIEAVADSVRQAGVDPASLSAKAGRKAAAKAVDEEVSCDVVVVGAGAAGSAAALSAAESGAKVLLLEKTLEPMGAGTLAGGMFANGTAAQKASGQADASEWLFRQYMSSSNGRADAALVRAVIEASGPTADWLNVNGARLAPIDPGVGGQPAHIGDPKVFMGYVDGGSAAIAALNAKLRERGGEIRFETPATELIVDASGKVAGVVAAKKDGGRLRVRAGSVVLATGGFGGNEAMMRDVFGAKVVPGAIASDTGDGIRMAWKAGAAKYGLDTAQFFYADATPEAAKMATVGDVWNLVEFPLLWVNENGKRFCDEEVVFDYSRMGNALYEQPDAVAWMIFDQGLVDTVKAKGTIALADIYGTWKDRPQRYMEFNEPCDTAANYKGQCTPYDFGPFLEEGQKAGIVVKADRLEELGARAGMDAANYRGTVAAYAAMVKAGKDSQFFKSAKYLYSLDKGPYYAVKITTRCLGTLGGVKIDEEIRAVNEKGRPIPGLWVAGADAGGMYGNSYVQVEGGTLGFAYTSGRIAGRNAAASALGK
jgi:fumarate reductase flavoprotein subunit